MPTPELTWLLRHSHTQHQESVFSLLHSPSGSDFPFQYSWRVVEKKASSLTLSEWLQTHQFLKHTQPLIPLSTVRRPTTAYHSKTNSSQLYEENKYNRVTTQMKGWTQLKSTRRLRVVLGPRVAKTNQKQPHKILYTCNNQNPGRDQQPNPIMKQREPYTVRKWLRRWIPSIDSESI